MSSFAEVYQLLHKWLHSTSSFGSRKLKTWNRTSWGNFCQIGMILKKKKKSGLIQLNLFFFISMIKGKMIIIYFIVINRDWLPKFGNWLNIKIGIVQKKIRVTKLFFCQNDSPIRGLFWQKDTLVYEQCLFWYLAHSQILEISLYYHSAS